MRTALARGRTGTSDAATDACAGCSAAGAAAAARPLCLLPRPLLTPSTARSATLTRRLGCPAVLSSKTSVKLIVIASRAPPRPNSGMRKKGALSMRTEPNNCTVVELHVASTDSTCSYVQ